MLFNKSGQDFVHFFLMIGKKESQGPDYASCADLKLPDTDFSGVTAHTNHIQISLPRKGNLLRLHDFFKGLQAVAKNYSIFEILSFRRSQHFFCKVFLNTVIPAFKKPAYVFHNCPVGGCRNIPPAGSDTSSNI